MTSCDFLEVQKIGKSTIENFYSDVSSVEAALNGAYNLTYSFYDKYMVMYPEVAGDLVRLQASTSDWVQQYNFISDESEETTAVGYVWKNGYEIISNANEIIKYAPDVADKYPQQAYKVNNYLAQAYFLRALAHLDLCLVYGQTYTYTADASHLGIAVMTYVPSVSAKISRTTAAATYSQVIKDLEKSLGLFSEDYSAEAYYASPAACKALLARVYLYMGEYSEAADYADAVINDYGLSLTPRDSYVSMYCGRVAGSGSIFRLNGYSAGTYLRSYYDWQSPKMNPSGKLLSIFSEDAEKWGGSDVRADLLSYTKDGTTYSGVCMKFCDTEDITESEKRYDPFVLRLAEMYLIRAEANCRLGNLKAAADDVAVLEARARGLDAGEIDVSYSSAEVLDDLIMRERIKELYLEGHRLFDITRRHETLTRDSGTTSSVTSMAYPDDRFILPIPLVELDANDNMQSNPINSTQQ